MFSYKDAPTEDRSLGIAMLKRGILAAFLVSQCQIGYSATNKQEPFDGTRKTYFGEISAATPDGSCEVYSLNGCLDDVLLIGESGYHVGEQHSLQEFVAKEVMVTTIVDQCIEGEQPSQVYRPVAVAVEEKPDFCSGVNHCHNINPVSASYEGWLVKGTLNHLIFHCYYHEIRDCEGACVGTVIGATPDALVQYEGHYVSVQVEPGSCNEIVEGTETWEGPIVQQIKVIDTACRIPGPDYEGFLGPLILDTPDYWPHHEIRGCDGQGFNSVAVFDDSFQDYVGQYVKIQTVMDFTCCAIDGDVRFVPILSEAEVVVPPCPASDGDILHVAATGDGSDGETWATAYTSIADAIAAASGGDDIWIKTGTYNEAVTLKSGVSLYGGFAGTESDSQFHLRNWNANPTVIDATGTGANVLYGDRVESVAIDGLHVTGGTGPSLSGPNSGGGMLFRGGEDIRVSNCRVYENELGGIAFLGLGLPGNRIVENCDISRNRAEGFGGSASGPPPGGGGLFVERSHSFLIRDCTIQENYSSGDGGGLFLGMADSSHLSVVERCVISDNEPVAVTGRGWGGGAIARGFAIFSDCEISRNRCEFFGGGLWVEDATVTDCRILDNESGLGAGGVMCDERCFVQNCEIVGNKAALGSGGIHLQLESFLAESVVRDNTGDFAGGVYCRYDSGIRNCLIAGNQAVASSTTDSLTGLGGGVITYESLVNCTVVNNTATNGASGIYFVPDEGINPPLTMTNSIVWGNTGPGQQTVLANATSEVQITYSDIQGGWPGEGNIDADPSFADSANGDFTLRTSSPCVDTASVNGPTEDLFGVQRPVDIPMVGRNGTGNEFDMGAYEALKGPIHVALSGDGSDGETWATAYTSLADAITAAASGDSIWIKTGTYNEAVILKSGVSLYGGFAGTESNSQFHLRNWNANPTVIDATGTGSPVFSGDTIEDLALDGLTITGGSTPAFGFGVVEGGGISIRSANRIRIANCRILRNRSVGNGGGIAFWFSHIDSIIENCQISENHAGYQSEGRLKKGGGGLFLSSLQYGLRVLDCTITHNYVLGNGGGILSLLGSPYSPPRFERCLISENEAAYTPFESSIGGGASVDERAILIDCEISRNRAASGAGGLSIGGATMTNCRIVDNEAEGVGGGVTAGAFSFIQGCEIVGNKSALVSGGLYLDAFCVVAESVIEGNVADQAGGIYCWRDSEIRNCLIAENEANGTAKGSPLSGFGGGGILYGSMVNSTVTDNLAVSGGQGLVFGNTNTSPAPDVTNSIIWGNNGPGSQLSPEEATDQIQITYSDIQGGWPGAGNIDADPLFVDADAGIFRLTPCSPCVDTAGLFGPEIDIEGTVRPLDILYAGSEGTGAEFDMGAYEADPGEVGPCAPPPSVERFPAGGGASLHYDSLTEALLETGAGDELVMTGYEELESTLIVDVPNVTLRGEGIATLAESATCCRREALLAVLPGASGFRVEGIAFIGLGLQGGVVSGGSGIDYGETIDGAIGLYNEAEGTVAENCRFRDLGGDFLTGGAAAFARSGSLLLDGCSFNGNQVAVRQGDGVLQILNCQFSGNLYADTIVYSPNNKGTGSPAQTQIVDSTFTEIAPILPGRDVEIPEYRIWAADSPSEVVVTGCLIGSARDTNILFGNGELSLLYSAVYNLDNVNRNLIRLGSLGSGAFAGIPTEATIDHCDLFNHGYRQTDPLDESHALVHVDDIVSKGEEPSPPTFLQITNSILTGDPIDPSHVDTTTPDVGIVFHAGGESAYSVSHSILALEGIRKLGLQYDGNPGFLTNIGIEDPYYANVGVDIQGEIDFHYSPNSQAATFGMDGGPIGAYGPDDSRGVTISIPSDLNQADGLIAAPFEVDDASGVAQVEMDLILAGNLTPLAAVLGESFPEGSIASDGNSTNQKISLLLDPVRTVSGSEVLFVLPFLAPDEAMSTTMEITAATVTEAGGAPLRYQTRDGEIALTLNLIPGDVDFSERIDVRDVAAVLRHIVGIEKLSALGTMAADVVDPGVPVPPDFIDTVGIDDALAIYMQVSGETNGTE